MGAQLPDNFTVIALLKVKQWDLLLVCGNESKNLLGDELKLPSCNLLVSWDPDSGIDKRGSCAPEELSGLSAAVISQWER